MARLTAMFDEDPELPKAPPILTNAALEEWKTPPTDDDDEAALPKSKVPFAPSSRAAPPKSNVTEAKAKPKAKAEPAKAKAEPAKVEKKAKAEPAKAEKAKPMAEKPPHNGGPHAASAAGSASRPPPPPLPKPTSAASTAFVGQIRGTNALNLDPGRAASKAFVAKEAEPTPKPSRRENTPASSSSSSFAAPRNPLPSPAIPPPPAPPKKYDAATQWYWCTECDARLHSDTDDWCYECWNWGRPRKKGWESTGPTRIQGARGGRSATPHWYAAKEKAEENGSLEKFLALHPRPKTRSKDKEFQQSYDEI